MTPELEGKIERYLEYISRNPKFKKSNIGCLTHDIISKCQLEDLKYLNLAWIAWKLKVSESYITQAFKGIFGKTPSSSLVRRKMELARDLLLDSPGLSMGEVAERLDYSSANYFIKVFKKNAKITPKRFRSIYKPQLERTAQLKKLAMKIQISINKEILEDSKGEKPQAVYVHGGLGKLRRRRDLLLSEFLAPGIDYTKKTGGKRKKPATKNR
ncbi:MAG: helix-turn-helix transcriptional regulator [bacterium]|nr:helix-turn-helix transcriptional regulator [bacterium]